MANDDAISVTTTKSSIMNVFSKWEKVLGIDAVMKGMENIYQTRELLRSC